MSSNSSTLVSSLSYDPFGGLTSETYGNSLIHAITYNNRLQPSDIKLGTSGTSDSIFKLSYIYGTVSSPNDADGSIATTQNNGNVGRIKYTIGGTLQFSQTYQYDALNRLTYGVEHNNGTLNDSSRAWYQTFTYGRWGNRAMTAGSTSSNLNQGGNALGSSDFSSSTNRISKTGYSYDNAGNLTAEPGSKTYSYDGENKMVTAVVSGTTSKYWYDADGRRVKKVVGSTATRMVYNLSGQLVAEYTDAGSLIKEYVYKGGALVATIEPTNVVEYVTADHLGTPRVWTNSSGSVISRHDYAPFGEELTVGFGSVRTTGSGWSATTQADGQRKQFTGKERDTESGLDFFEARYFASIQGRFTSTDPIYYQVMMAIDPQRFNSYAYARNNPLKFVDPNGERVYIRGNLDFLRTEVLYQYAGGQETFDQYFQITEGQVTLRDGVNISNANAGVQELAGLVNATENYLFFAGTDGGAAADLFQGTRDAKGKLTSEGKAVSNSFTCGGNLVAGCGTAVGTTGRTGQNQPANLANGDPVFAVIAYNTNTVQTQTSTNYGNLNPVPDDVKAAQEAGVGKVVQPVRLFIHESIENREFARQGAGNFNYANAHAHAIRREAVISRELKMTGGFAGGFLDTRVPKK